MATIGTFLMHGLNYLQFFKKNKDFDHLLFEHSMLLNCKIEKEHFPPIYSGNIDFIKINVHVILSYLYKLSK